MKFESLKKKKRHGFTLVEMVIVVTILGIVILVRLLQLPNAEFPIVVTLLGIV